MKPTAATAADGASGPARDDRLFWAAVGAAALAVLGLARFLQPDPSGLGTHTQLGLPPCLFLLLTSLPCPACGLTTAFAHMARLQPMAALRAHMLGVPLFALTVLAVPLSVCACACGWPAIAVLERLRVGRLAVIIAVAALLHWIARLAAVLWS